MKTKMLKSAKYATLLLVMLLVGSSCSDDPVQEFNETQWKVVYIEVKASEWIWDEGYGGYIAEKSLPELTKFIYTDGLQVASVFIGTEGVDELQKPLPYIHTYSLEDDQGNPLLDENDDLITFTETISCDFQVSPSSSVGFYIQGSDLKMDEYSLYNYTFRIVLMW